MIAKIIILVFALAVFVSVAMVFILHLLVKDLNERVEILEHELENINPKLS